MHFYYRFQTRNLMLFFFLKSVFGFGEVPEPQCVCKSQETVCGSEGKTYENICQFNKAYAAKRNISMKHKGPCESGKVYRGISKLTNS
uniref:Kazal-like domain-containing protein n=1 Tax=Malurus cyaneus samueli TaxID=2593467 RepID=A0A8C5UC66_9PASS